jgi:hypothetical protein
MPCSVCVRVSSSVAVARVAAVVACLGDTFFLLDTGPRDKGSKRGCTAAGSQVIRAPSNGWLYSSWQPGGDKHTLMPSSMFMSQCYMQRSNLKGFQGRLKGLQGRLKGFQGRLKGFQGRLKGLQGRLKGLQGRLKGLQGRPHRLVSMYSFLRTYRHSSSLGLSVLFVGRCSLPVLAKSVWTGIPNVTGAHDLNVLADSQFPPLIDILGALRSEAGYLAECLHGC